MRIALLNFYKAPNPDNQNIASALRERGHNVYLGQRGRTDDLEWYDREGLVAVLPGPLRLPEWSLETPLVAPVLRRLRYLPFMLRVRRWLRQTRPDIVQVNPSSFHGLWILPLFMPRRMRFLLDVRQIGIGARPGRIGRFRAWWSVRTRCVLARWFYDGACFNHVATARRVLGERWSQWATVVPVGISPTFLSTRRKEVATGADLPLSFVYLGALSRVRELELLFQAIQRVQASTSDFRVLFVGPDLASGHYQRLGDKLDLDGVAVLRPPVPYEEIPELLADCDVGLAYVPDRTTWHLQPTIKVLEYRAAGLPILSTDVGGHRESVEHGVNGLLVQNTVEGLSEAMLRFINDSDFLENCRSNAARMRRALTIDRVAQMYEQDVYQKLVE
jgi:glycosyltransferase involved in cell wall biosynthesis